MITWGPFINYGSGGGGGRGGREENYGGHGKKIPQGKNPKIVLFDEGGLEKKKNLLLNLLFHQNILYSYELTSLKM